jgi:HSP20 family protein
MNNLTRTRTRNRSLQNLQSEIDRLFDSFFPSSSQSSDDDTSQQATWAPRTDLVETEGGYRLRLDLPGVTKDDVNINFHNNTLSVSGKRSAAKEEESAEYVRVERTYGHFYRSFSLPRTIDAEGIEASFDNGVLTISVPKSEESKPRQIEIN